MIRLVRVSGLVGVLAFLALAVPLPHVDELRNADLSAVAPFGAEAAQAPLCDKNPKAANLNFVLKDSAGNDFNLAAHKGKVILLDFWATWCPPCKVEIPWFVEFQRTYGPKGFIVIGVSVDDPASVLKPFGDQYKVNYPLLVGDGRADIKGPRGYNATWGLPKTFVIGRDGAICKTHVGLSKKEHFEQQIKSLL
ncbi:MAG TPA: redoxin domain-containing protein [Vicinamibacterales bacterium]|nr:redoxin domain-containing protein [Vicinamibacterales bacterium]